MRLIRSVRAHYNLDDESSNVGGGKAQWEPIQLTERLASHTASAN